MQRRERPAAAYIQFGDPAAIEPDRDKPGHVRPARSKLLDRQHEFFVVAALLAGDALGGEADDEGKRVVGYSTAYQKADLCVTVLHGECSLMPRLRREALCCIPGSAGRDLEGGSWV